MTRVAVVGLGTIAFEHLAKLRARPELDVVGVCDLSPTLAEAVVERFGLGRPFDDFAEMLTTTRPDVVHVLTPPASHRPLALAALESGAHVLVEKPMAPSLEEYVELRDTARDRGLLLCENYNCRFMPAVLDAHDAWQAGELGDILHAEATYTGIMAGDGPYADREVSHFAHGLPGGALQNFVTHPLSLVLPFVGDYEQASVISRRRDPEFASDDELVGLLRGSSANATIVVSRHAWPPELTLTLRGTRGRAEVDVLGGACALTTSGSMVRAATRSGLERLRAAAAGTSRTLTGRRDAFAGLGILLDRFYAAAAGRGPCPVTTSEMDAVNGAIADITLLGAVA